MGNETWQAKSKTRCVCHFQRFPWHPLAWADPPSTNDPSRKPHRGWTPAANLAGSVKHRPSTFAVPLGHPISPAGGQASGGEARVRGGQSLRRLRVMTGSVLRDLTELATRRQPRAPLRVLPLLPRKTCHRGQLPEQRFPQSGRALPADIRPSAATEERPNRGKRAALRSLRSLPAMGLVLTLAPFPAAQQLRVFDLWLGYLAAFPGWKVQLS